MCTMLNVGWPALLVESSFLLNMNLSNELFGNVLSVLQSLAWAAGCLTLPMPCDAFLTMLAKAVLPLHVIAALNDTPLTLSACSLVLLECKNLAQPPGLSARNLACLHALVAKVCGVGDSCRTLIAFLLPTVPLLPSAPAILWALHSASMEQPKLTCRISGHHQGNKQHAHC